MAIEWIIRASKWVMGGKWFKCGVQLTPLRAFMDDKTTLTTTALCTRWLLEKLQENITQAKMKIKPSKSRGISSLKKKLLNQRFFIYKKLTPTVSEKPINSLGRYYDARLKNSKQVRQLKQDAGRDLEKLIIPLLPGKLKLWSLLFGLLPWLLWPLTEWSAPMWGKG